MDAATATPSAGGPRRRRLSGTRVLLYMLGVLALTFVPAVLVPNLTCRQPERQLDNLGAVPAFSLVDEQGRPFTEEALRGHPTIVSFIFTRCDTVCPVIAMKVQKLEEKTRDKRGIEIKFVSYSVDPEHDKPAALAAFATRYRANPERWRFLTGDAAQIRALVEGPFMSPMDREGVTTAGAPNIVHSGYLLLVDGDLQIRGVYDSNDVQRLDELLRDARFLARTHRSGYKFGGT